MAAATLSFSILLLFVIAAAAFVSARASITVLGFQVNAVILHGVFAYPNINQGIAGASVRLSCDGGLTKLDQATTGPTGAFELVATSGNGALFEQSLCGICATASVAARPAAVLDISAATVVAQVSVGIFTYVIEMV